MTTTLKSGWLFKEVESSLGWRRRFFVLLKTAENDCVVRESWWRRVNVPAHPALASRVPQLEYFDDEGGGQSTARAWNLGSATISNTKAPRGAGRWQWRISFHRAEDNSKHNAKWVLSGVDRADALSWVRALREHAGCVDEFSIGTLEVEHAQAASSALDLSNIGRRIVHPGAVLGWAGRALSREMTGRPSLLSRRNSPSSRFGAGSEEEDPASPHHHHPRTAWRVPEEAPHAAPAAADGDPRLHRARAISNPLGQPSHTADADAPASLRFSAAVPFDPSASPPKAAARAMLPPGARATLPAGARASRSARDSREARETSRSVAGRETSRSVGSRSGRRSTTRERHSSSSQLVTSNFTSSAATAHTVPSLPTAF
jgi:hypothetical protein